MSNNFRIILIGLGLAFSAFLLWYFSSIVIYILISAILSLIGSPIMKVLGKVHISRFSIPMAVRALLTLLILYGVLVGFFVIIIPVITTQAQALADLDSQSLIGQFKNPIEKLQLFYDKYQVRGSESVSFQDFITEKISHLMNVGLLSDMLSSTVEILGNLFIALFSITFITFFFLQDRGMLAEAIVILSPEKHSEAVRRALGSIKHLLVRYFVGVGGQLTGILILVTTGMIIAGFNFPQALVIGLIAAIFNIIPYIGPIIGTSLGILLGFAFKIENSILIMWPLAGYMLMVYIVVHLIDNFIFQPFIFSNSVNAHPLEIFLVILMAGSIGGVLGMIIAVPGYTILRVFAKEFFNNLRVVQKLTKKI